MAALLLVGAADLPDQGPIPASRPDEKPNADMGTAENERAEKAGIEERPQEDDEERSACRAAMTKIGALFEEAPRIDDDGACGIERPVLLKQLPGGVRVQPAAVVRCDTALQLSRWMEGAVKPSLAAAIPGDTITGLSQASAYVCRNRNGAQDGTISEHAFGNAIDIAGFTLKSGRSITIRPANRDPSVEGAFQRAIAEAACLYFTTVLDPGSDAAHQNHLHLDVKERGGGYRYCW